MAQHIGSFRDVEELLPPDVGREVNIELTFARTVPGRNQNNTVGSPNPIDGRGSVFQDRNIIDLIRIHPGEISPVAGNAIHDNERIPHAANVDGVVEFARLGGILGDANTRNFPRQHIENVLILRNGDILAPDGRNGAGKGRLFLCTVSDDNCLFEKISV